MLKSEVEQLEVSLMALCLYCKINIISTMALVPWCSVWKSDATQLYKHNQTRLYIGHVTWAGLWLHAVALLPRRMKAAWNETAGMSGMEDGCSSACDCSSFLPIPPQQHVSKGHYKIKIKWSVEQGMWKGAASVYGSATRAVWEFLHGWKQCCLYRWDPQTQQASFGLS